MIIGKPVTLTLKRVVEVSDNMGGTTETWSTVATFKGALPVVSGSERMRSDRVAVEGDYRFYTKYKAGLVPTEKDRFTFGSRTFEITFVDNVLQMNRDLVISLKEIK